MNRGNSRRGWGRTTIYCVALLLALLMAAVGGLRFAEPTRAASPAAGNISATVGASVNWVGDKTGVPNAANGEPTCTTGDASATNCDVFALIVNPGNWAGKRIAVRFNWNLVADDYDMTVRQETNGTAAMQGDGVTNTPPLDAVVSTSGNGTTTFEEVILSPPNAGATYYVRAIYFAVPNVATDQYQGSATVESTSTTLPPGSCALPTFDNYQPPVGYSRRDNAGEPSIGVNWNTGNVMTMSRLQANRTYFNDSTSPANPTTGVTWFPRTSPAIVTGLDPIGYTDPVTGRSIFGELNGAFTNAGISDDDLTTFTPNPQSVGNANGPDHQTIGGGPPNPNVVGRQPTTNYPHLFYYAAQGIAAATVSTSFDGGVTYSGAIAAYTLAQCGGLHGHIKVSPDGTVYLPNKNCSGKTGMVVSVDNGLTWTLRTIPTSTSGATDPSVGIGAGGRVYLAYAGGDNHPHVAVTDDKGVTWRNDFDLALGVAPNLTAAVFMQSVAGDNNRAAVFFLATDSTNAGDPVGDDNGGAGPNFAGTWYPYIATTCDGGASWSVTRADNDPLNASVPNPVQQGVVCTNGTLCPAGPPNTRNLLDFNEIAVDARGRVVAVYADGCNFDHPCILITNNSGTRTQNQGVARLTIIRQRGGMRLFAAFDPGGPAPPPPPPVLIEATRRGNNLKWTTPDDGGSPLKAYRIYRGASGGGEKLIAEVKPNVYLYRDRTRRKANYYYRVTAVNAYGESPRNVKSFANRKGD